MATRKAAHAALRKYALSLPGAVEEFPWGERVVKVNKKVFVFLGHDEGERVGMSVKLPHSAMDALELPFCEPTGYGLGKSGWVSVFFDRIDDVDVAAMKAWILESWRAVAPKKVIKAFDAM